MAGSVAQFKNRPEPNQSAGRAPAGAHRNDPAPKAECDESCIRDQEPEGKIVADEAAHKTGWSEHLIQPGDVLFYRVCCLSNNQQQEHKLSFAFHKISSAANANSCVTGGATTPYFSRTTLNPLSAAPLAEGRMDCDHHYAK